MRQSATQTPTTTQSVGIAVSTPVSPHQQNLSANMAATAYPTVHQTLPHMISREQRPTLPPLQYLGSLSDRRTISPLTTPPISRGYAQNDPFQRQTMPQSSPSSLFARSTDPMYPRSSAQSNYPTGEMREQFYKSPHQASAHDMVNNPLKRPFGTLVQPHLNVPHSAPFHPTSATPAAPPEPYTSYPQMNQSHFAPSSRSSFSEASTPSQTQSMISFMGQGVAEEARPVSASANTGRLSLLIRQQPRAARAGPDGKDRRAIDPPPVLQLLIDDFDPDNEDDMHELKSSYFVVQCRLVSAGSPKKDLSTLSSVNEDGSIDVQRLLLGTAVSSPFFCQDDPDPDHMPLHPITSAAERPPSPSSRFIASRNETKSKEKARKPRTLPGSFFIFADLSVRKAGEYRLEFGLMKIDATSMMQGRTLPIIHSVTSSIFKVVNAKDFDQVQPSTELVKGLLDRGAGFPLKLKKGIREGQRKKQTQGESDEDDSDDVHEKYRFR